MNHRVTSMTLLFVAAVCLAVPSAASAEEHAGWTQALDGKGEFGFLQKWFIDDGCYKQSFAQCKDFKAALKPPKWPGALFVDALKLNMTEDKMTSTACVSAWGCDTAAPSLEIITLRGDPADKALLLSVLGNEKVYAGQPGMYNRSMLVRLIGWYGDKSLADLVKKYIAVKQGQEYSNYALSVGTALYTTWNNNGLIEECKAMFSPDVDGYGVDEARTSCAFYLARFGDKSIAGKLGRMRIGGSDFTWVIRALMGDAGLKEEWQTNLKEFAKSPDRPDRAAALLSLALTGDAKAEKEFLANVFSADGQVAFSHSNLLSIVDHQPIAKKIADAAKAGLAKIPNKEIGGRAKANVVGFLLKQGVASVLPTAKAIFASDDSEVRQQLALALNGMQRSAPMVLASNGAGAGAPIAGLGAVLDEAWSNETDNGIRNAIAYSWAMIRSAGGN